MKDKKNGKKFFGKIKGSEKNIEMDFYKIDYDPLNKIFSRVDIKAKSMREAAKTETRLMYTKIFTNKDLADAQVEFFNKNMVKSFKEDDTNEAFVIRHCNVCDKYFIFTFDEYNWFKEHDLYLPSKCKPCRKAARNKIQAKGNKNDKINNKE